MKKSRRLGWLLLVLLGSHALFLRAAFSIPQDPSRIPSEVKFSPQTVRVKLSNFGEALSIRGTQVELSLVEKPQLGTVRSDEWLVDCKRSIVIQVSTGKARTLPSSGVLIESFSGYLSLNDRRFREQIVAYPSQNGQCLVVNHLNIEKYLESVVNGEFNSQWAENAVQAQIIAARTYALFQMNEVRKSKSSLRKVYDVESTQKDQVYLGMDSADLKGAQLVAQTRGLIMVDPKSNKSKTCPIKAFYHASCGGNTVLPQEVWGSRFAGFGKVRCPFCTHAPSFNWDYRMSFHDVQQKIIKGIHSDPVGRKAWPAAFLRQPEDWILMGVHQSLHSVPQIRVNDLVFEFVNRDQLDKKLKVKMNAYLARNWLDPSRLKSTLFTLIENGRSVVFKGKGSGHGVGMCQWGAKKMGESGFSREKILAFYYPGVKISRVW